MDESLNNQIEKARWVYVTLSDSSPDVREEAIKYWIERSFEERQKLYEYVAEAENGWAFRLPNDFPEATQFMKDTRMSPPVKIRAAAKRLLKSLNRSRPNKRRFLP